MTESRGLEYLIKLKADAQAAANTRRKFKEVFGEVETELKTIKTELSRTMDQVSRTNRIEALGVEFGKLANKIKDTDKATAELTIRLHQMGATSAEIEQAGRAFAGASDQTRGARLRAIGSAGRALPSMQIPGLGIGTDQISNMIRMGGAISDIAETAGISTKSILGVSAAAAALAITFAVLHARFKEVKAAADAELNARDTALRLLQKGNVEEIQARINELAEKKRINQQIADDSNNFLKQFKEDIRNTFGDAGYNVADFQATFGIGAGELAAAREQAAEANKVLSETTAELDLLTGISGLSAQTTADLAAQEERLNMQRQIAVMQGQEVLDRLNAELEVQRFLKTASVEALDERRKGILAEIAATTDAINELEDLKLAQERGSEAFAALQNDVDGLIAKHDALQATYNAFGQTIVGETALRNDQMKAQEAAAKDLEKISDDVNDAIEKNADDLKKIADRYTESFNKLAEAYKLANDEASRRDKEERDKLGRTRADKDLEDRIELEAKLDKVNDDILEQSAEAEEKRQQALERIRNEFALSEAQAIQDRDAVALDAAIKKRDSDTAEANSQLEADVTQIQENAAAKRKQIQDDFNQDQIVLRLQRAAQDRERDIANRNDAEARRRKYMYDQDQLAAAQRNDLLQRNQAFAKQLTDLNTYLTTRMNTEKGYFGTILAYAQTVKNKIGSILGTGSSSSGMKPADKSPFPERPPGAPPMTPFATGGFTQKGGMALLHPGEVVLNPQQQRGLMGGVNIAVNGVGLNKAGVIREVVTQLDRMLVAAGM